MSEFEKETLVNCFRKNDGPKARNTDKFRSKHAHYYEEAFSHLKTEVTSLLEIGINRGGSIKAWRDFFVNATIYGIDIRRVPVERCEGEERIFSHQIDIGDINVLTKWAEDKEFDIVIDDGSHYNIHQIIAFEVLWPRINPGGYFVIEDTRVSWDLDRIKPGYPILEDYINKLIKPITRSTGDILQMTIRPNMVVFRKKRIKEPTIEDPTLWGPIRPPE